MPSRWSHPSVLAIGANGDPVAAITQRARRFAYRALEQGWSGPPFDPVALAELHGVDVYPGQAVFDAVLTGAGRRPRIEFNPDRPPARIRYSVAHELAHMLFPDFALRTRHRGSAPARPDDWQLELLCNLAAAELLMPDSSFPVVERRDLTIDRIVDLHREFQVSVEAAAFQVARTTSASCVAFTAASHSGDRRYLVDYAVGSRQVDAHRYRGARLPEESVVTECIAVGVTGKGRERWDVDEHELAIEAIGVPPYPGEPLPRVVGIRLPPDERTRGAALLYLRGDATRPRGRGLRIVAHVVNDRTPRWGGGFASAVKSRWPEVQASFVEWARGRGLTLGDTHLAPAERDVEVFSMVAQHGYGPSTKPRLRYLALESALNGLGEVAIERAATVHVPMLGAGQAGGNWSVISEMLTQILVERGVAVTVYVPTGPDPLPPQAAVEVHPGHQPGLFDA